MIIFSFIMNIYIPNPAEYSLVQQYHLGVMQIIFGVMEMLGGVLVFEWLILFYREQRQKK